MERIGFGFIETRPYRIDFNQRNCSIKPRKMAVGCTASESRTYCRRRPYSLSSRKIVLEGSRVHTVLTEPPQIWLPTGILIEPRFAYSSILFVRPHQYHVFGRQRGRKTPGSNAAENHPSLGGPVQSRRSSPCFHFGSRSDLAILFAVRQHRCGGRGRRVTAGVPT